MRLSHWMKTNGFTHESFYEECKQNGGGFSRHALDKWCTGKRIPRADEMSFIFWMTKGEVEPNDFYHLEHER